MLSKYNKWFRPFHNSFQNKLKKNIYLNGFSTFSTFNNEIKRHVMSALVVNQPGCLAQIANLFSARGYNIDSLVVGRTEVPELSRLTVVVNATNRSVINMKKQLEDVVYVAVVNILTENENQNQGTSHEGFVERDLMLGKISTKSKGARTSVIELANLFEAKILGVLSDQLMVQLAGHPSRIESFIELLEPYGIIEVHRSGVIAMTRKNKIGKNIGEVSFEDVTKTIMNDDESETDVCALPPG